jgi:alpha-amylase/alpha-mannosidase (GH57 family)
MNRKALWTLIGLLAMLVGALPAEAQDQAEDDVLYVAIIWHQHQPVYFKDPETGVYERPWVRVHAAKDYLDMAAILEQYPDIHVTFNITPSLIRQLDDIAGGAKDLYWVMSEIPAEDLTGDDKAFILARFFDINPRVVARFPRYQELAEMRDDPSAWEVHDFRDLQVLFNLAWTDPDWLAEEPLASLVAKGRGYEEADKEIIFVEHLRIVQEVIPLHARLQAAGQIEVTMTPFAHPILPLLVDSNVAQVAMPEAELPTRFVFGQDAVAQVNLGVEFYREHLGVAPRGMWPAEGAVSQSIVQMVARAGIQWMASDEEVLARSLAAIEDFTRDSADTVQQADALYRPYTVTGGRGGKVAIIFRDHLISDKVGFEYSGMDGQAAADDFIGRLNAIQAQLEAEGAEGPHLVTVLLDGENAWEYYDNDGKAFLHAMYQGLSQAEHLRTVTPSEYLAMIEAPRELESLWPGSWINHDFGTWIGEEEENQAWEYLLATREMLRDTLPDAEHYLSEERIEAAMMTMYIAEGSDWFWWYGADQNSGSDEAFDAQFRRYLEQVYSQMSKRVPSFVYVPLIAQAAQQPDRAAQGALAVAVDGVAGVGEWDNATAYILSDTEGLYYGFDDETFYLRLDAPRFDEFSEYDRVGIYLRTPDNIPPNAYSRYGDRTRAPALGFGARKLIELTFGRAPTAVLYQADGEGNWIQPADIDTIAVGSTTLEVSVPIATLSSAVGPGDRINMRLIGSTGETNVPGAIWPPEGPALAVLPDKPVPNVVLEVADPTGDDHGPGTYTYPHDGVFRPGVFDATGLVVGYDDEAVIFRVMFRGPVDNVWGSPNGLSVQAIDVYIDVDGPEGGARILLPGRNAALTPDFAWDYAIWAEGWTPGIYRPGDAGPVEVDGELGILTNPGQRRVTIRVPRSVVPSDPATWAFAVVVASQEGYPSAGVWRLRDVLPEAERWRIGGGPEDINHTRLMDIVWPRDRTPTQEEWLSAYPPSQNDLGGLGPDDFPQVPMLWANQAPQ